MDAEKIPRAWIGEEVRVSWGGDPEGVDCSLLDVVPEGVVIEYVSTVEIEGSTYEVTLHSLISWSALRTIHKVVGYKEPDAQAEDAE